MSASTPLPFILGSGSASRRSILAGAGLHHPHIIVPNVDEDAIAAQCDGSPQQIVCALAEAKATAVATSPQFRQWISAQRQSLPQYQSGDPLRGVIVAGDSMLLLDGELQGKPHTVDEAIRRWHQQRGKSAQLLTGHCVLDLARLSATSNDPGPAANSQSMSGHDPFVEAVSTTVYFADVSDADIDAYARTEEPLPCAGAFTLEAIGGWFIDRIEGDPSSVIGLSLPLLRRAFYHFGYHASDFWDEASQ